jgi:hypothetical protein
VLICAWLEKYGGEGMKGFCWFGVVGMDGED